MCTSCGLPLLEHDRARGMCMRCYSADWKQRTGYNRKRREAYRAARARGMSTHAAGREPLPPAGVGDAQLPLDLS